MKKGLLILMVILSACTPQKEAAKADVHLVSAGGTGDEIGTVTFTDTPNGLQVDVDLHDLPQGEHGFHIHQNASCEPAIDKDGIKKAALAAGGHYDPDHTGKHLGPDNVGHKGDLPVLNVAQDGTVKTTFFVQNLTAAEAKNHSIMIHAGGDNYADTPQPLGGGGARIACGVIK